MSHPNNFFLLFSISVLLMKDVSNATYSLYESTDWLSQLKDASAYFPTSPNVSGSVEHSYSSNFLRYSANFVPEISLKRL